MDRYPLKTHCPNCGSQDLIGGAKAGLSQNKLCVDCLREYNYTPFGEEPIEPARLEYYNLENREWVLRRI